MNLITSGILLNKRTAWGTFALLIGILVAALPVKSQENRITAPPLPQGEIVQARIYPWSTIGKLNNGVGGSCTAVLISRNYALTAAHCLFFRTTGRFLPAESLHLILGYENQQFRELISISAYYISGGYDPLRPYETLASDWALLSISSQNPLTISPLPLSEYGKMTGEPPLMTAGYSHIAPYAMTADRNCRLVGRSHDDRLLFDSCKAPAGYSGAPVLVRDAGTHSFSLVGIHVANQPWQTNTIAIAIPVEAIWREIKPCVQNRQCQFQVIATGKDPTAAELLSGLPNFSTAR